MYKLGQNIEYLNSIGVPSENQQEILDYLMSLDKDTRKTVLRKIKKNPKVSLHQVKEFETDTKKDYLREQGYDERVVDIVTEISPKYAVWLAREMKSYQEEGAKNYQNLVNFWEDIVAKYNVNPIHSNEAWDKMTPEEKRQDRVLRYERGIKLDPQSSEFKVAAPWQDRKLNPERKPISFIIDYINANNPDIMSMSYSDALKASDEWHEELKQKAEEEAESSYISHNVVFKYPNGWEIVELEAGDCEPEGELMGNCVGGYARDIEHGRTQIFSLRDNKNKPHVTMEISIYEAADPNDKNKSQSRVEVRQIQGKGNEEPISEYKTMIKEWFDSLKSQNYQFDPMGTEDYYSDVSIRELEDEMKNRNEYGISISLPGIGGDEETYYDNLIDAYSEAVRGSYFSEGAARGYIEALVQYAEQVGELDKLQASVEGFEGWTKNRKGESVKTFKSINDWANYAWFESEPYYEFENERPDEEDYPNKEDFMITPDISEQQPEFKEMPEPTKILDEEAYNKAVAEYQEKEKAYEEELAGYEEYFEPYIFQNMVYEKLEKAREKEKSDQNGNIIEKEEEVAAKSKMKTRIYKVAKEEKFLDADASAQYIEALNLYAKEHPSLDKKYLLLIEDLPSPRKIRQDFSIEECKILFETIDYLWKKITGENIIQDKEIEKAPETLFGNYWLIKNGILLKGVNHYSIIKNNANLFCTLLNLNGMTLQEYLSNRPHKVIEFILNNGGIRMFVNKDRKLYAQMSSNTYGKWGKNKIKKYDFKLKAVKIIDFKRPYDGWKSGITIKL
jgi:hypothetical protein